MTKRGFQFVAFHVRDAVLPTTGDDATHARFHATSGAVPVRGAGVPTTDGGGFLPADVEAAALPTTGGAATPVRFLFRAVSGSVRVADRTGAANEQVPAAESRAFPATSVRGFGGRNDRGCLAIHAGYDAELPAKLLPQCRRCRPIAVG